MSASISGQYQNDEENQCLSVQSVVSVYHFSISVYQRKLVGNIGVEVLFFSSEVLMGIPSGIPIVEMSGAGRIAYLLPFLCGCRSICNGAVYVSLLGEPSVLRRRMSASCVSRWSFSTL